jgi:hypothetical protein
VKAHAERFFFRSLLHRLSVPYSTISYCLAALTMVTLTASSDPDIALSDNDLNRVVPEQIPFSVGEQIDFHVMFGIIPAGKAQLAVVGMDSVDGQLAFHALSTARSAKAYDLVFKVRDSVETWFDADSIYTHFFRKRLNEGPYHDEKVVQYDLADQIVRWWDDGVEKPPINVPSRIQDVLSAGYKVRTLPLALGDTLAIRTHDVDKTYDLLVIVHDREPVETDLGVFDCFKVEPVLRSGGIFKKEKGARVFVWVTADDRRIPVKMQSKVSFGSITAIISAYRAGVKQLHD